MEQTKDIFGKRLFEIRESRGESQQELADSIDITRQSLSRYELGERTANIDLLKKIAKHYNVSTDYLLGIAKEKTTDPDIQVVCDYTGLSEDAVRELHFTYDSISQQKNLDLLNLEEYEYVITELLKTLSWLISEQYIYEIIEHFSLIKKYSQQYLSFEDEIVNNGLYSIDDKTAEQTELNNMVKLQEIEKNIDFERYMLVKLSEKLSNHFDQREHVKNNGKHNTSKE